MRIALFPILLFQAAAVLAQVTIGAEGVSDPLQDPVTPLFTSVSAVAMAKDRTGVAIAWVMPAAGDGLDRVFFARLDATLHITGPVQSIPRSFQGLQGNTVEQIDPSLAPAPSGEGFTLAWMERSLRGSPVVVAVYSQLDADLKPSPTTIFPFYSGASNAQAIVRSSEKTTWLTAGGLAWEIQKDGSVKDPLPAGLPASGMTIATDFPQFVAGHKVVTNVTCGASFNHAESSGQSRLSLAPELCHTIPHYGYQLQFVSLYSLSASKTFSFESDAEAAIASDGRDVLIVWFRGTQATGGDVVASRLQPSAFSSFSQAVDEPRILATFGPDSGLTRPDIATDGERYVVVWRIENTPEDHDVVGASIDRAGNVIPLSIARTVADERDPSVIAVAPGRFLVAYEKSELGSDRRIAGRFVTFEQRSHAAR